MPDLSGLEVLPQLRTLLPTARIIIVTLCDFEDYRQAALAAGADDFVSKRNPITDLLPAIPRVAQTGRSGQELANHPGAPGLMKEIKHEQNAKADAGHPFPGQGRQQLHS